MRTLRHASILFTVVALIGCSEETPTEPVPDARMDRILREVMREFPDVESHFDGMSYDESFRAGGDLAQRGMPRLDDRDLLGLMRQRHQLLSSSEDACAALAGGGDAHAAMRAIDSLSDDELRAWTRRSARAQQLEIRGGPRPMSAEEARRLLSEGIARIRAALPPNEQTRWDAARTSDQPLDACYIEKIALRELLRLPSSEGVRYERAMLEAAQ